MRTLIAISLLAFVGCEAAEPTLAPPQGEHSVLVQPGCKDGMCVDPALMRPMRGDCLFGNCPQQPSKPQPTPPFSFAPLPEDNPAPSPEITTPTKKAGPNVDLIIALVATVAGMIGAYVASNNDDDPTNDMSIADLTKDIVKRLEKARQ